MKMTIQDRNSGMANLLATWYPLCAICWSCMKEILIFKSSSIVLGAESWTKMDPVIACDLSQLFN